MPETLTLPDDFRRVCEETLTRVMERTQGAYGAVLATIDGHAVLSVTHRDLPSDRIAAMTSSLLALGETIAREAQQRQCKFVIVENSDGYVVTLRITAKLTLSTFSGNEANLGMLLSASRNAAESIGKAIPQRTHPK
jgi:predicted regulator of Ras-like GTPase activity (Roadblock/LC7/MglB family)